MGGFSRNLKSRKLYFWNELMKISNLNQNFMNVPIHNIEFHGKQKTWREWNSRKVEPSVLTRGMWHIWTNIFKITILTIEFVIAGEVAYTVPVRREWTTIVIGHWIHRATLVGRSIPVSDVHIITISMVWCIVIIVRHIVLSAPHHH